MQFETTKSICALCKSALAPSADAYPGPSRLCRPCQQLVQTILPRAGLTVARQAAPAVEAGIHLGHAEDSATSETSFDYAEAIGRTESSLFNPEEESYYKTELEIQPDPDETDDFVEDFPGAPHESLTDDLDDLSDHVSVDFSPSGSAANEEAVSAIDEASSYDRKSVEEAQLNVTQAYGVQPASDYLPPITTPLTGETARENARDGLWSASVETQSVEVNTVETDFIETNTVEIGSAAAPARGYDQSAIDPWDNPLPAWDYSHSEYPVLLGPRKDSKRTKLWLPVAAGLLIVGLIAGYFILSQPNRELNQNQNSIAKLNTDPTAPDAEDDSAAAATRQQDAPPQASTDTTIAPATIAEAPQPPALNELDGQATLTLQSAAFPDEAGANDFSAKLIRAGIPAYVVPADLPRKGRWFRVRVGRFTNADDARKYATQSRLRAKAAGMDLDFIVVEYGKP
jgi:cell division septation protein DedD